MKINLQLIGAAFTGGVVLSLIELTNMLKQKETPDVFFFGGLFLAGVLGVVGYLVTGANNFKTAFACGISAPQLFGGLVKVGSTGAQALSLLILPLAPASLYAAESNIDSTTVLIVKQIVGVAEIKTKDSVYTIEKDSSHIKIKYQDFVIVETANIKQKVPLSKNLYNTISINETESSMNKFFRGITAQRSKNKQINIISK